LIIAGVVALIAAVAVVVAIVAGGDDEPSTDASIVAACTDPADPAPEVVDPEPFVEGEIFQPVGISGTPLAEYTGDDDPAACASVPVLSGYDYTGSPTVIDPAADGPTLVVFLAHWCPHCNREVPVLNDWRDSGNVPDELNVVGVSTAAAADRDNYPPDQWLETMDWTWPVLADGDITIDDGEDGVFTTAFRSYGTTGFPTMAFVDSAGRLRWRVSGEMSAETLQQLVDEALAADGAAA
jgi:thiol-disulfide isomerase/thioredoxin